jgi:hypothetical protein
MIPENSGCTKLMWHQPEVSDTVVSTSVFPLIRDNPPPTAALLEDAAGDRCCTLACAGAVRCSTASSKTVSFSKAFICARDLLGSYPAGARLVVDYRHETPLPLAFHMMVMADAFVMSRSSLSMAAALLSNGTVAFLSAERRLLGPRSSATAELAACRLHVGSSPASGQLPSKWAALELFTTCNMHIGICTCPSVPRYKSFSHCSHMFDHMLGMFITNI